MGLKSLISNAIDGGSREFGHPDLLRKVVDGIVGLRRYADRGVEVLPPEIEVRITVPEGGVRLIERFVQDPGFDREIEAGVRNRMVRLSEDGMPVRRYVVEAGEKTQVTVVETPARTFRLRIEGGDRDGTTIALPSDKRDVLIGRGPWHGTDQQVSNDVVVSEANKTISRRAARLHRAGATFELQSLDQREALVVRRPDGQQLRPALSASGRVPVRTGDVIEFTDAARPIMSLVLEEEA